MAKRYKKTKKSTKIFLFIFIVMLIVSGYKILQWKLNSNENKKILQEVQNVVTIDEEKNTYIINFKFLKQRNSDTIAWIKVNGTNIEYPIVQTENNSYYMRHNLNKEYNVAGWIFMDYKNKLDGNDKNIVIYGHNMHDDSMFGTLRNILEEDWYNNEQNYVLNFITEKENLKYRVFSVYKIENEDYYIKTEFEETEFSEFVETLKNRSIKNFNVEVTPEDSILTLSTCADNNKYRIVLHAKKMSEE